jgi:hypothetical protein
MMQGSVSSLFSSHDAEEWLCKAESVEEKMQGHMVLRLIESLERNIISSGGPLFTDKNFQTHPYIYYIAQHNSETSKWVKCSFHSLYFFSGIHCGSGSGDIKTKYLFSKLQNFTGSSQKVKTTELKHDSAPWRSDDRWCVRVKRGVPKDDGES